jgi:serine phosphatase RsbU (regulator of sigma subunit)
MNLRTKLILSFFLLAILPLALISLYSYSTSIRAFRQAVGAESAAAAEELSGRMESVKRDLTRRMQRLSQFPFAELMAEEQRGDRKDNALYQQLLTQMGDSASLVEALEFTPSAPVHPPADAPKPPPRSPGHPMPPVPPPPNGMVLHFPGEQGRGANLFMRREGNRQMLHIRVSDLPEAASEISQALDSIRKVDIQRLKNTQEAEAARQQAQKIAKAQAQLAELQKTLPSISAKAIEESRKQLQIWRGNDLGSAVQKDGAMVGRVRMQVSSDQILRQVFSRGPRKAGEIPFALDSEGKLHTTDPADQEKLSSLPIRTISGSKGDAGPQTVAGNWIVVTRKDPGSDLIFGIARPIGIRLEEIRRTAVRNLGYGFGMVALALLGILPISNRITRDLSALTKGAEHLARGDLQVRVPVKSKDEFGKLAQAFNRMAQDLSENEKHLVEQERLRKEVEMCRRIQEELLPRQALRSGIVEAKGVSIPAREVGGDFFNYFQLPRENIALLVGDVSGKGLPAALLMANVQATLQAKLPLELDLVSLAEQLDADLQASTPPEVYLTLFLGIFDPKNQTLRYVNAGHNSQYALHVNGEIERLESTGRPLGLLPGGGYEERCVQVFEGDYLFFYTDGLVEAENARGEEFGASRLEKLLVEERQGGLDSILARIEAAGRDHLGGQEAPDDATMMLVKIGAAVQ